jgi:hypothetical protein
MKGPSSTEKADRCIDDICHGYPLGPIEQRYIALKEFKY